MTPPRLTIEEAEQRHPDLVKGQRWRTSAFKYEYMCEKHGVYRQSFNGHDVGHRCPRCTMCTANRLSKTPEYLTIMNHFQCIFFPRGASMRRSYKNMPFHDDWNPTKGGSYLAGAEWILKNLGKRPKGCSLHIIDHEKGFVPGNLEWSGAQKQSNEKMFKIIARLKHRIKELEAEIAYLKSNP